MSKNMQMKKETEKISHRKFLSENIGLLLIAPVFLLLMFTVSNLYQLPAEYVFYLTSIFLILWVTTLCMQYWGFRKRTEQYEKESKEKQESNSKESRQWEELQEKQDFFCIVGTSDQDTDRGFESSFAGRKAGCGSMPTGII